jgi:hypothetical protein
MRVLILSYSAIDRDPRVLRQIHFFEKMDFKITLSSLDYSGNHPFIPIVGNKTLFFRLVKLFLMLFRLTSLRKEEFLYQSNLQKLKTINPSFDLIFANDIETWPIGVALKKHSPHSYLVFDAHEYYAKHFSDVWIWNWFHKRYMNYLCEKCIPVADRFITVCDGISREYEKYYGVNPILILNAPNFEPELTPSKNTEKIQIIHHGISNRSRKIEKMIHLMDHLDERFELKLMLVPSDPSYFSELKKLAKGRPVEFLDPVPTQEISAFINRYDIGLFILEPVNFNYANALPNKFFEFIQARLAIAIGPSPEMKKIVEVEKNGVVTQSFDEKEMATTLNSLSKEDFQEMKKNSHRVAAKYSNQLNEVIMEKLLEDLSLLTEKKPLDPANLYS